MAYEINIILTFEILFIIIMLTFAVSNINESCHTHECHK